MHICNVSNTHFATSVSHLLLSKRYYIGKLANGNVKELNISVTTKFTKKKKFSLTITNPPYICTC